MKTYEATFVNELEPQTFQAEMMESDDEGIHLYGEDSQRVATFNPKYLVCIRDVDATKILP